MRHGIGVPSFRGNPRSVLGGVFISENSNKIQILFESPAGEAAPAAAVPPPLPGPARPAVRPEAVGPVNMTRPTPWRQPALPG